MDPSSCKQVRTKRGLTYSYYISRAPATTKPVLLFLHGFPSTSYDWRHQVAFFRAQDYTVIVPDLLGYGGTDKPTDPQMYRFSGMCADVIDVLNAESVKKGEVVVIGHDWGSALTSRLANFYPEYFLAFAFLAAGYSPPSSKSYEEQIAAMKAFVPYNAFGYWKFFSEPDADKILEGHWDSFTSMIFAANPKIWRASLDPNRTLKQFLLAGHTPPTAAYLTPEDNEQFKKRLRDVGIGAALNWYKTQTSGIAADDNKSIPQSKYTIHQPVFFGACKLDYVCIPAVVLHSMRPLCPDLTVREFEADHWVQLAIPDQLNHELATWLRGVGGSARL